MKGGVEGNVRGLRASPRRAPGQKTLLRAFLPLSRMQDDVAAFSAYPFQNLVPLPWNNDADGDAMIELLRTDKVKALILDAPFADFKTGRSCDLFEVGGGHVRVLCALGKGVERVGRGSGHGCECGRLGWVRV